MMGENSVFWLRQELKKSQSPFVRPFVPTLSQAPNLYLLGSDSLRPYLGSSKSSLRENLDHSRLSYPHNILGSFLISSLKILR